MRKIISSMNITPDGFCDHTAMIVDDELHHYANEFLKTADTVFFGRITYQLFESYWPQAAKTRTAPAPMVEFADLIDDVKKIVFSKTLKEVNWKNSMLVNEIKKEAILKLKQEPGKHIIIWGSPGLVAELTSLGLIDEYHFLIHPMIPGNGKRFFENIKLDTRLQLKFINTATFRSGVIIAKYQAK
jgi:dihydrofolate reductase